jgi:hypothetical protein
MFSKIEFPGELDRLVGCGVGHINVAKIIVNSHGQVFLELFRDGWQLAIDGSSVRVDPSSKSVG